VLCDFYLFGHLLFFNILSFPTEIVAPADSLYQLTITNFVLIIQEFHVMFDELISLYILNKVMNIVHKQATCFDLSGSLPGNLQKHTFS